MGIVAFFLVEGCYIRAFFAIRAGAVDRQTKQGNEKQTKGGRAQNTHQIFRRVFQGDCAKHERAVSEKESKCECEIAKI